MPKEILLTPEGFQTLQQELEELRTVRRREVAEQLRQARAHGDLRENFAYEEAKRQQALLEGRIRDLQYILERAKVVERSDGSSERAHLGSSVTLRHLNTDQTKVVTLVGSYEADPIQDRISILSPLGEALIGRAVGEVIEVQTPRGMISYRIEAVE